MANLNETRKITEAVNKLVVYHCLINTKEFDTLQMRFIYRWLFNSALELIRSINTDEVDLQTFIDWIESAFRGALHRDLIGYTDIDIRHYIAGWMKAIAVKGVEEECSITDEIKDENAITDWFKDLDLSYGTPVYHELLNVLINDNALSNYDKIAFIGVIRDSILKNIVRLGMDKWLPRDFFYTQAYSDQYPELTGALTDLRNSVEQAVAKTA